MNYPSDMSVHYAKRNIKDKIWNGNPKKQSLWMGQKF